MIDQRGCRLLGSESLGGIERCGAAGGNGSGEDGYRDEDEEGSDRDADVRERGVVEKAADEEVSMLASASPQTEPMVTMRNASTSTIVSRLPRVAPTAMRTPNSGM